MTGLTGLLQIHEEVEAALNSNTPVVALETTFLVHGLPPPDDLLTAQDIDTIIRAQGAVPAFIGVDAGRILVGMQPPELEQMVGNDATQKASRRDLAALLSSKRAGATTVSATMVCAALAGIEVFATGGIGGVHKDYESTLDASADLIELGRTPVAVVCSGAKSILDLPRTLEYLETLGVPVIGYGVDRLPAFYVRECELDVDARVDTPIEAAKVIATNRKLGETGVMIANPICASAAIDPDVFAEWLECAVSDAHNAGIRGKSVTPFLLNRIFDLSAGVGLVANKTLLIDNARLGALIAGALVSL